MAEHCASRRSTGLDRHHSVVNTPTDNESGDFDSLYPGAQQQTPVSRAEPTELSYRLTGATFPPIVLNFAGPQLTYSLDDPGASLVIYFYPGCSTPGLHESDTPLVDAEQHRNFRDHCDDFAARHFTVVGISSQSVERQREAITANQLPHQLAHDGSLRLANELRLPTFHLGAERFFERLTLVTVRGVVRQVFYPISAPGRHAAEVAARVRAIAP